MASSPSAIDLPRVAIVGKPNVGKSTLFNRLVRSRQAITDSTPGVTRDAVVAEVELGGARVLLVDTGGFTEGRDPLETAVTARSLAEADRAEVVLLVLDATDATGVDRALAKRLRPMSERIVIVANKVDSAEREQSAWELYSLGYARVVMVSAETGRNVQDLEEQICALLRERGLGRQEAPASGPVVDPPHEHAAVEEGPDALSGEGRTKDRGDEIRVAIVGKPNTGKSTLLNRLLGEERSLVSELPGTTRDVVEGAFRYRGRAIRALDTAGIRRKSRVDSPVEFFSVNRALRSIEQADIVLLIVDTLDGVTEQDKKIASAAVHRGAGTILVLNKWDLAPKTPNALAAMRDRVAFLFPVLHFAPVMPISARTGEGIDRVLDQLLLIREQMDVRVGTAPLNRSLQRWLEQKPVPHGGRNLKVKFMAQTGTRPTTFVCRVNRRRGFPQSYVRFLENRIRQEFGLPNIPLRIKLEDSS